MFYTTTWIIKYINNRSRQLYQQDLVQFLFLFFFLVKIKISPNPSFECQTVIDKSQLNPDTQTDHLNQRSDCCTFCNLFEDKQTWYLRDVYLALSMKSAQRKKITKKEHTTRNSSPSPPINNSENRILSGQNTIIYTPSKAPWLHKYFIALSQHDVEILF